jgi:DNA-binding CsgD family transcriptional regulator
LLATGQAPADRAWAAYSLAWRGLASAMVGKQDRAITDYEEALDQARVSGSDGITLFILDDFAGLLLEAGHLEQADVLAAEAMEIATRVNETWLVAHAVLTRASIDAAAGNAVRAALGLGAAEALYVTVGLTMPPPLQRRRDLAEHRTRQALGAEAFERETGYGRTNPIAVVAAALRREREQLLTPAPGPAVSFTRREADVLRLLATGMTDREIAENLFISRKTASNHVASILHKAGVETRAAAAIFAVRAGLV